MRSGPKGRSLHSVPPRHVSAFLPARISSSTHCGKQPITHKGAQAVPELRVGGDLKAASCPLLCIEAAPDTHVTSQMAGHPQGLWTAISSNLKLRTEEALKYFGEFTWLWRIHMSATGWRHQVQRDFQTSTAWSWQEFPFHQNTAWRC